MSRIKVPMLGITLARGIALFFGVFSLANALGAAISQRHEDVWWIDLSYLPGPLPWIGGLIAAVVFAEFAVRPRMKFDRKQLTTGVSAALGVVAVGNGIGFYRAAAAGTINPVAPIPFSFVLAVLLAGVALVAWYGDPGEKRPRELLGVVAVALAAVILFPLSQVYFFGTTDYRRPADVAVVLGARVHDDGTLSSSLMDRVSTGVELYREGLVPRLIMSGGTGVNGVDEAEAMRQTAIRLGVPEDAVDTDPAGVDTDATVRNTSQMIGADESVLVVSQFYHLPRIKLAYRTVGREVRTVPAEEARPIPKTPVFVAREIGGFWVYWLRALGRDLRG